jgi:DNA-binding NarL/FixJ family response regulator
MEPGQAPPAQPLDVAEVWERLATGQARVAAHVFGDSQCSLQLHPTSDPEAGVFGRQRVIVESVLQGICQNAIAIDLQVASSTVALYAKQGLARLGVDAQPSRAPAMLMLIASVAGCPGANAPILITPGSTDGAFTVRAPRPDLCLLGLLSAAEHDTLSGLFAGHSYAEIARRRGTSPRTIANQVSAAFRALSVSGRNQMIYRAFVLSGWLPESETASREVHARAS